MLIDRHAGIDSSPAKITIGTDLIILFNLLSISQAGTLRS